MRQYQPNYPLERRLGIFAWGGWLLAFVAVAALVWHAPMKHSDCWNYYQPASDWWHSLNLYRFTTVDFATVDGFLYLPQFALFYSPFMALGHPLGDVAWRGLGWILLATGLWRASRMLVPQRTWIIFAFATLGTLASGIASLRNGEANLHVAGILLHAAADIHLKRWGRAALWLGGGIVVKPIVVVMTLLAAAMYRPLIPRLALALVLIFAVPFCFQHFHYVWQQYYTYETVMTRAAQPAGLFCNLRGLLGKMGWIMPQNVFKAISIVGAVIALGLCLHANRAWPEPEKIYFLFAFSACYLMLCNPRTEASSYVMLAPAIALPAAIFFAVQNRPRAAMFLYFLCFLLICDAWAYKRTENWLKPLTCLLVSALLIRALLQGQPRQHGAETPALSGGVLV